MSVLPDTRGRVPSFPVRLALAVLPVIAASVLAQVVTFPSIPTWHAGLVKPSFNPPNWLFGPVWTALYAMMAYAAFRILSLPRETPGRSAAMTAFYVQMALNAVWSCAFFGLQSTLAGLVVMVPLWLAIAETMRRFLPLDRTAGLLFVPYLAWVSFAAALNLAFWWLNG